MNKDATLSRHRRHLAAPLPRFTLAAAIPAGGLRRFGHNGKRACVPGEADATVTVIDPATYAAIATLSSWFRSGRDSRPWAPTLLERT